MEAIGAERVWAAWFVRLLEIGCRDLARVILGDKTYTFCLDSAVAGFFPALLISAVKYSSSFSKEITAGSTLLSAPVK